CREAVRPERAHDHPDRAQGLVPQIVRTEGRMSLLGLFKSRASAPVARERLQILLAHERSSHGQSDILTSLRDQILAVVAKQLNIDREQVRVKMVRGDMVSTLDIDIEVPHSVLAAAR